MATLSPTDICTQIQALDARLVEIDHDIARHSLAAAEGDAAAAGYLASIIQERGAVASDRSILVQARTAARWREQETADTAHHAARANHMQEARTNAATALKAAQDMDKAIAAFIAAAAELGTAEGETRRHLRLAGESPDGRVGRHGAAVHGHFLLARLADGTARRRNDRSVSELVAAAWHELLEEEAVNV